MLSRFPLRLCIGALMSAVLVFLVLRPKTRSTPLGEAHRRSMNKERADAVKAAFEFAWSGYHTYAFPNDDLKPLTNGHLNTRNGWGASAVDSLTTAIVMELSDVVDVILSHISHIDFYEAETKVSLLGSTLRYLGPLLSAQDMLHGPVQHLNVDGRTRGKILRQAKNLANALSYAFDTPSGIPFDLLWFEDRSTGGRSNDVAAIGALVLEWTRLADLTRNQTYADLVQRAEAQLLDPQPASAEPFPGLVGRYVNIGSGQFEDATGGYFGGAGSYYEYLIKMYVYDSTRFEHYKDRWVLAADSTMKHLASSPSSRPDLTFLAQYNGTDLIYRTDHTSFSAPGMFILGGDVLKEEKYLKFGLQLLETLREVYLATASLVGPEEIAWLPNGCYDCVIPLEHLDQAEFNQATGYYITKAAYLLRPEVLESMYYAYRVTGDTKYQDWAWEIFTAIITNTRAGSGFAELDDVNQVPTHGRPDGRNDRQNSFMLAETLKYAYLIFAQDAEYQAKHRGLNRYVFNTGGHPIFVSGPPM